jgi:hypothetical protein
LYGSLLAKQRRGEERRGEERRGEELIYPYEYEGGPPPLLRIA